MQSTLNPIITQKGKAAPKVNLLLLTKNPRKINLDSLPLISHTFFGFLLINASLKLHYKNIHTLAHIGESSLKISVIDYILQKFSPY